jgi:hypothetical protein
LRVGKIVTTGNIATTKTAPGVVSSDAGLAFAADCFVEVSLLFGPELRPAANKSCIVYLLSVIKAC